MLGLAVVKRPGRLLVSPGTANEASHDVSNERWKPGMAARRVLTVRGGMGTCTSLGMREPVAPRVQDWAVDSLITCQ